VDNPLAANQTIPIGGPAALSWLDAVRIFEEALGRPIQVNYVPPGRPLPGLPPFMAELMAGFARYDSLVPMDETAPRFGVQLTSLEEFVKQTQVNTSTPVIRSLMSRLTPVSGLQPDPQN
jgi:uncharacterized protein YbjT (DUF2867 family)